MESLALDVDAVPAPLAFDDRSGRRPSKTSSTSAWRSMTTIPTRRPEQ